MTATRSQLLNSDGDPRGHRYNDADHEAAYRVWSSIGRRSFSATAEKFGISENTLRQWASVDTWKIRAKAEDDEAAELARVAVLATVVGEINASVATLVSLRDDSNQPGKVRVDCALALLAIGGVSTKQSTQTTQTTVMNRTPMPTRGKLSPEEQERISDRIAAAIGWNSGPDRETKGSIPYPSHSKGVGAGAGG